MQLDHIGFDTHKRTISFAVKHADGTVLEHGVIPATRSSLDAWVAEHPRPWRGAMEATLFTGWIYDHLKPHAVELLVAHPARLEAIATAKKKNDRVDAEMLADLLRCNLMPVCYMAPTEIRDLRRSLRIRNLIVRQATSMKNRMAGILMECGEEFNKQRLHQKKYFSELLGRLEHVPDSAIRLLRMSRGVVEMLEGLQRELVRGLQKDELLRERVRRLMTVDGVGPILALTWALEVGEVSRLSSIAKACSYCGLTSAQRSSGGKEIRGPISKQRNSHLQWVLVEAAKLAPRYYPHLRQLYEQELQRGHRNRATLVVARKLVAYLLAVDRSGEDFRSPDSAKAVPEAASSAEQVPAPAPSMDCASRPLRPSRSSVRRPESAVKAKMNSLARP